MAGLWSYKAGEKGRNRVRVYEDRCRGPLLAEFYDHPRGKKRRVALKHSNRERAKQQADEMAAAYGNGDQPTGSSFTLASLFKIYLSEVTPTKSREAQVFDRSRAEMFLDYVMPKTVVRVLNRRHWDGFINDRLAGTVAPRGSRGQQIGARTVERDLKFLMSVLNWATTARNESGYLLLPANPLKGLKYPKERSPKRPVMTHEQYEAILAVASDFDWRFRIGLVLAHETGHRRKAILSLKWTDIDFHELNVTWRADNDKIGFEHTTPLTDPAVEALRVALANGNSDWVIPSPTDTSKACSGYIMHTWLLKARMKAGVTAPRMGWHSLRRKFATELKNVPLVDVCQLGGWKEASTLLKCYQKADPATMRKALESRSSVTDS